MNTEEAATDTGDISESENTSEIKQAWLPLTAAFIGIGCGISSLSFYTTGIFMIPWQQEFGWSRTAISSVGIFAGIILALMSPVVGALIDKLGFRHIAFFSLIAYAVGILAISFISNSLITLYMLSILTALLASGSSPVTFTRAVTEWFNSSRGLALGIALMGTGAASVLAPILLTQAIENFGWRDAYRLLALIVFFAATYVYLFLKTPAMAILPTSSKRITETVKSGISRKEALQSWTFYQMSAIFLLVSTAVSGMIIHFIPMLSDLGVTQTTAGTLTATIGASIIVGRLGVGFLIDRFFAPYVAAVLFGLASIGFMVFIIGGVEYALVAALAIGLSMGAEVDLIGYMISRYFGLKAYGVLYGTIYSIFLVGAAISPFLAGLIFDKLGSYDIFLIMSAACLGIASLLCLSLKRFPKLRH
ncbi:MFS transporter [Maricurvus nonylphenolicus]|uniref:MFS transporter n=1 Tax=Maricurvus nonylphenolicus TaxID=1008307 RepID=UPI0036F2EF63